MYCVDCEVEYDEYPCPLCGSSRRKSGMKIDFNRWDEEESKKEYEDGLVKLLIPKKKKPNV